MFNIEIDGKKYDFVVNGNTFELYYQIFGEDLLEMAFTEKNKKTMLLKNQRGRKLAFVMNYQAAPGESWKTLTRKLNKDLYMEWSTVFPAGVFLVGQAADKIAQAFAESLLSDAEAKNAESQP